MKHQIDMDLVRKIQNVSRRMKGRPPGPRELSQDKELKLIYTTLVSLKISQNNWTTLNGTRDKKKRGQMLKGDYNPINADSFYEKKFNLSHKFTRHNQLVFDLDDTFRSMSDFGAHEAEAYCKVIVYRESLEDNSPRLGLDEIK